MIILLSLFVLFQSVFGTESSTGSGFSSTSGSGSGSGYEPYDPGYDYFECPDRIVNYKAFGMEDEDEKIKEKSFVASVGDHPNSTTYGDVQYNTTKVNLALKNILDAYLCSPPISGDDISGSWGTNRSSVGFSENGRQLVLDNVRTWPFGDVVCAIATEAYYFGNSFVFTSTLRVTVTGEGETVDDVIQIYVTDPTVINDVRYWSNTSFTDGFGDDDGGMYTAYNYGLSEVAISGLCVGLTIYINQTTGLIDELTAAYGLADLIVPGATRDVQNLDGDIVSYMQTMRPGSIFEKYPRQPHFIGLNMHYFVHATVNIPQMYADGFLDFSNSVFINFGPTLTNGLGKYVRFRMGDGINNNGILGALPVIYSTYALFDEFLFPNTYRIVNEAGKVVEYVVEKPTLGRFRFTVAGCNTTCFNNATHYLGDSDTFNIDEALPKNQQPFKHLLYWDGMSAFLRNLQWEHFYTFQDGLYQLIGGLGVYINNAAVIEFSPPTDIIIAINPSKNTTDSIFAQMGEVEREDLFGFFGLSYDYTGLYLNLRNTPRYTSTFGASTGLTLIKDVFNFTHNHSYYLPIEVPLFFGDSANDDIAPGKRVPTSSTIEFADTFKVVFDITNILNNTDHYQIHDVGLGNPDDEKLQLSANNVGHPSNEVLLLGNLTVDKLSIRHNGSDITVNCVVKSCWNVFSDDNVPKITNKFSSAGIAGVVVVSIIAFFFLVVLISFLR